MACICFDRYQYSPTKPKNNIYFSLCAPRACVWIWRCRREIESFILIHTVNHFQIQNLKITKLSNHKHMPHGKYKVRYQLRNPHPSTHTYSPWNGKRFGGGADIAFYSIKLWSLKFGKMYCIFTSIKPHSIIASSHCSSFPDPTNDAVATAVIWATVAVAPTGETDLVAIVVAVATVVSVKAIASYIQQNWVSIFRFVWWMALFNGFCLRTLSNSPIM